MMETTTPGDTGQEPPAPNAHPGDGMSTNTANLSQPPARHLATTSDANSPLSSTPNPPKIKTSVSRRTSQVSQAPNFTASSPKLPTAPLRRASSSASMNRPPSSPRLSKKPSRSSMGGGGTPDEQDHRPTPKRSISNLISGLREAQSTMEAIEEPIPLTAAQVATDHFTRELLSHSQTSADAETVVILHDACYGHRWSRLKTPKSQLQLIVERPERIHASVLGASTAYVRLGGHHENAQHAPHPDRSPSTNPPFTIRRSARSMEITSAYVTNVHGTPWMGELQSMCHSASEKLAAGAKEVSRAATPGEPEKAQLHEGDLYLSPGSLAAFQGALGGVADAVDTIFSASTKTKRAFVAVRPPGHHCSADHPSGFCWLNNVHVGIEYAAQMYGLTHAAILDFDLHHGDGSQAITWERNSKNNEKRVNAKPNSKLKLNPDIGYYSLHDINSYPCEWGDAEKVQAASLCIENAHGQSIWNVHLQPWKNEGEFWQLYESRYRILLDKAKLFLEHHATRIRSEGKVRPKSAIFISAGFDASEWEGAGMQRHKVSVPTPFYARFTEDVVKIAQEVEGCEGRVISVLEGGYSDRALCSGVLSHLSGLCASPLTPQSKGVGSLMDLSSQMGGLNINGAGSGIQYDTAWWSAANLTALEHKVNPPPPPQAKKGRTGPQPTYATPTESFAYKVVDANKFARSISGTLREPTMPVRPPTPPPPDVDWIVATQELSKLLIPTDRQTKSCTADELAGPKKERQSAVANGSAASAPQNRQLRDRRAKAPAYAESAHSDETASVRSVSRAESRASRRETIAVLPCEESAPSQQRRASRRLSAVPALSSPTINGFTEAAPPVPALPKPTNVTNGTMKPPAIPASGTSLANKKVRAPSKPRQSTSSSSAPGSPATKAASARPSAAAPPMAPNGTSDIDSLTSGMKKVTLKVSSSKEEHDRKQREKDAADRRARALKGAETRRINAAAKKAAQGPASAVPVAKKGPAAPRPQAPVALPAPHVDPVVSLLRGEPGGQREPPPTNTAGVVNVAPALPKELPAKENMEPAFLSGFGGASPSMPAAPTNLQVSGLDSTTFAKQVNPSTLRSATPMEIPAIISAPTGQPSFAQATNNELGIAPPALRPADASTALLGASPVPLDSTFDTSPSWSKGDSKEESASQPSQPTTMDMRTHEDNVPRPERAHDAMQPDTPVRPSELHKGNVLPVFTSTGPIPFAPNTVSAKLDGAQRHGPLDKEPDLGLSETLHQDQKSSATIEEKSVWDVPDTPAR